MSVLNSGKVVQIMDLHSLFSDDKRRTILAALEQQPCKFVELKHALHLPSNILAYNLNKLIKENLVEKNGLSYSLSDTARYLMPYVSHYDAGSLVPLPCVAVIVRKGKNILVRTKDKEPGKGTKIFVGGRINLGENIFAAAQRHARDKVNIGITNLRIICINNYVAKKGTARVHFLVFFITADPVGHPLRAVWKDPAKIRERMFPDNKFILKNMLQNREVKVISSMYDEDTDELRVVKLK